MKKFLPILVLITLVLPIVTVAQVTTPLLPTNVDLLDMIAQIANYLFWILLAISIVVIVYAGILFVTASGSAEQVEKARGIILYAIVGIIVAFLAYGIRAFLLQMTP
ncbi:MAG TPA: hypothetical protein VMV66_02110 [Candidatus Humimicrobiaceae bacterium]|nr:hypothetical protein [Candidatus Humimicrobiaceae bacterium]